MSPTTKTTRNATLIMKATRLCNLRCEYCHDWRAGRDQTMTFETLAATTRAVLTDPTHKAVEFVWHGGEPTLLGTGFFEKALQLQARFRQPHQHIKNTMQTNATRIDDEWLSFWRRYDFGVGMSLDGPAVIHDASRRYATGKSSFGDVAAGIARLRAAKMSPSVLMVVDRPVLEHGPDFVFDFFLEMGISSYGLLAAKPENMPNVTSCTPIEHYVNPAEFNVFLTRVYDRWRSHGDPSISIREIDSIRNRLSGESRQCTLSENNCVGDYFLVDPDGTVAHCDLFLGDDRYTFGNVKTDSFAEMRASAALTDIWQQNEVDVAAMSSCSEFATCQGWCPHERYISASHNPHHSSECCGLKPLIEHVREHPLDDSSSSDGAGAVTGPGRGTPVELAPRRVRPLEPALTA